MASSLSIKSLFVVLPPLLFSPGCLPVDEEIEGDEAGECSDGVDNDQDGVLDCDDEGCAIATACAGDDDDDDSADDDSGDDDDSTGETYLVTASSTGGGEISPEGGTAVGSGESLSLILTPDPGMEPGDVEGTCGGTLDGLSFTTDPVVADCTVTASFQGEDVGPAPYCSDIPPEVQNLVTCDPEANLDDWSVGGSSGINGIMIPSGRILSLPFTANAAGSHGFVEITNNMPGLVATGLSWHGWFSAEPGGPYVKDNPPCRRFSPNPNPLRLQWNQTAPAQWECHLDTTPRTLYFNMEVACIPELETGCTPGERYDGDYYLQLSHGLD